MQRLRWYPGNYVGFGVRDSRIYITPLGQVLAVLAEDVDAERADPIVLSCGLRPAGNGGECWCIAPILSGEDAEPPFPNACFATPEQAENYIARWISEPFDSITPIDEDEVLDFARFLSDRFELPAMHRD